jgi:hypothetical protein
MVEILGLWFNIASQPKLLVVMAVLFSEVLFINLFQVSTKKTKPRKGNNVSEIK